MFKSLAPRKFAYVGGLVALVALAAAGILGSATSRPHSGNFSARPLSSEQSQAALSAKNAARVRQNFAALPLAFEANQGQTDPQVKYMARGNGYTVFLTATDTVFALHSGSTPASLQAHGNHGVVTSNDAVIAKSAAIHMHLVGGNPKAPVIAGNELTGRSNYFIGNDSSRWHTNVAQYARVSYEQAYPGVDMAFHGVQKQLEFDFIVAPGASAAPIRLGVTGAKRIATDNSGNLILTSSAGDVLLHKPVAYQQNEKNGIRQPVDARFVLQAHNQVAFELGNYDRSRVLVIDPSVSYSTYLGGTAEDDGYGIAADSSGNAYVTGQTESTNFPGANPANYAGGFDVFVTKISADGQILVYSTYIGGSGNDSGNAIVVDASGDAFVAGGTASMNFPTVNPYQSKLNGALNAFVLELNPTGSALTSSTYVGGSGSDVATGLAIDSSKNMYIAGSTSSTDFPLLTPIASETAGGFVTKLNVGGASLAYSTYLGAGTADYAVAVAVDTSGNAYVTGATKTPSFPTTSGAFQTSCGTDGTCNGGLYDAFVSVISPTGGSLVYSTFLGGESNDEGLAIALDNSNDAYVTGLTSSTKFPVKNPFQGTFGGGSLPADAYVTEFMPNGTGLVYSTYLGGSGDDTGVGIAVDGNKNAYVTGQTSSTNFPVANASQPTLKGENDAFVSEIKAGGGSSSLLFSTYLGGSLNEDTSAANGGGAVGAIALDSSTNIYVTGNTTSTDFPTVDAKQSTNGGGTDAFVTKYSQTAPDFTIAASALSPASVTPGGSATSTVTISPINSYAGTVDLTCAVTGSGTPAPACSLNPKSGNSSTLTVTTTGAAAALYQPSNLFYAMWMPVVGLSLVGMRFSTANSRGRKLLGFLLLGLLMAALFFLPACSSSSGGGGGGCSGCTPAGSYTVTVTGTDSVTSTLTHATTVTLTVN